MRYLLDTCVLSEFTKPKPEKRVVAWLSEQDLEALSLSAVTVGEIQRGISPLPASNRRTTLEAWLSEQLDSQFAGRVLSLDAETFGAILVFRYLHRPLLAGIKEAVIPGGLVIYETFTVEQAKIGRPRNPDFLLQLGELRDCFREWDILHYFEGIEHDPASGQPRAIARIVAEKPVA